MHSVYMKLGVVWVALVFLLATSGEAAGQRRRGKRPAAARAPATVVEAPKLTEADVQAHRKALSSPDDEQVQKAAEALGASGAAEAAGLLQEALAVGTTPALAEALIAALDMLDNPESIPVLELYSGNRNVNVRAAAVRALAGFESAAVLPVLRVRLGDQDAAVRGIAAEALASREDRQVVDRLFKLVEKDDAGAAAPLGRLAPLTLVPAVAELRGRVSDAVLASALGAFLQRADASDRLRLDIVRTLGRIPGADATAALIEFVASLPEEDVSLSGKEAQTLVDQRGAP